MAIAKMERLRLIGLVEQRDELLNRLMKHGCLELTEVTGIDSPEYAAVLKRDGTDLQEFRDRNAALNSALNILREYAPEKKGLFIKRRDVSAEEFFSSGLWRDANEAAGKINEARAKIERLKVEESSLRSDVLAYMPWENTELPLDFPGTRDAAVVFGSVPASSSMEELEKSLSETVPESQLYSVGQDKEQSRFVLIYLRSRAEKINGVLRDFGFSAAQFRESGGTALELKNKALERIAQIESRAEEYGKEIAGLACRRRDIELCIDRCTQEIARETAKEHILVSGSVFAMEGWIDADRKKEAEAEISDLTCAWEFSQPEEWDRVPTLLKNPKWMDPINVVTEMYSLPAYGTIDPNPLIFFTYVFFFGFMFADVAYGLIIFALSALIVKIYDPKGTIGRLFRLGRYLGISTAICGIFVGGFFGDVITTVNNAYLGGGALPGWLQAFCDGLLVNPMRDPLTVLVLSVAIGACHLIYGQCVHIYMGFRDGHPVDYLLDVLPWWLTFAGIAALALAGSPVVLILGIVSLVCTQGRHKKGVIGKLTGGITSLYDITSWLSDILSYCRLMALMLATSVIASVANTLATLMQPPAGIILFVIVFCIFHVINIGINLIGTFVHAARLHYLEFFNKFYTSGGIPFRPLAYNTKYVNIIEEEK